MPAPPKQREIQENGVRPEIPRRTGSAIVTVTISSRHGITSFDPDSQNVANKAQPGEADDEDCKGEVLGDATEYRKALICIQPVRLARGPWP